MIAEEFDKNPAAEAAASNFLDYHLEKGRQAIKAFGDLSNLPRLSSEEAACLKNVSDTILLVPPFLEAQLREMRNGRFETVELASEAFRAISLETERPLDRFFPRTKQAVVTTPSYQPVTQTAPIPSGDPKTLAQAAIDSAQSLVTKLGATLIEIEPVAAKALPRIKGFAFDINSIAGPDQFSLAMDRIRAMGDVGDWIGATQAAAQWTDDIQAAIASLREMGRTAANALERRETAKGLCTGLLTKAARLKNEGVDWDPGIDAAAERAAVLLNERPTDVSAAEAAVLALQTHIAKLSRKD